MMGRIGSGLVKVLKKCPPRESVRVRTSHDGSDRVRVSASFEKMPASWVG